jgi:hypothetical protein
MKLEFTYAVLACLLAAPAGAAAAPPATPAAPAANKPSAPGPAESPPPAWKQRLRRETLLREGKELGKRGSFREALERIYEAAEIETDPKLLLWMGWLEEQLGLLVKAKAHYSQARADARAANLRREESYATEQLRALAPKIPRIALRIPTDVETTVTIDAVRVDPRGAPTEVDPGPHVVTAEANDRIPFLREVTLDPGGEEVVEVVLPARPAPEAPRPPAPRPTPRGSNVGAPIVGGLGLATASAGGILLAVGVKQSRPSAPMQGVGAGMIALGVGAGVGAIIWGVTSRSAPSSGRAGVTVALAPVRGGAFGGVIGAF